eukprot:scaffold6155_cov108-Cylindrotheca_fusiformis.AAC.10
MTKTSPCRSRKRDDRTEATEIASFDDLEEDYVEHFEITDADRAEGSIVATTVSDDSSQAWSIPESFNVVAEDDFHQDATILHDIKELLVAMGLNQQETWIYYCASTICILKFFRLADLFLSVIIAMVVKSRSTPAANKFIRRMCQRVKPAVTRLGGMRPFASKEKQTMMESMVKRLEVENERLLKNLEYEQWVVKSLKQSLSRKATILESEINNRAAIEQSSELVQALCGHEKAQLIEKVKCLEDEVRVQAEMVAFMESQAKQRDALLVNILDKFERSGLAVLRRGLKSDKYTGTVAWGRESDETTSIPEMPDAQ